MSDAPSVPAAGSGEADGPREPHQRASLDALFRPRRVAVVGASPSVTKAGHQMLQTLRGFPGDLVAIHPSETSILDVAAYPSLSAVPDAVDLAVLTVPPQAVPSVLRDAGTAGVRAAVICAGGFGESGPQGTNLETEVRDIAAQAGIRLLGPNTSGFANPHQQLHAVFLPATKALRPGALAVVAQSGGVNLAVSFLALEAGVGIRIAVGLGNAVDVGFVDVLEYLADDDATEVIALHIESVGDGRRLRDAVARVVPHKPVVALKVGRADVGQFARSHTGALTGDWQLTRSVLAQAGAVMVDDTTELLDACRALLAGRIRAVARPGVGVVTGQAGPALLLTDRLRANGVQVPPLADTTVDSIGTLLPPLTYQRNPVDTGRPGATFGAVVRTVAADPAIDAVALYALQEPGAVDLQSELTAAAALDLPVLCGTGGKPDEVGALRAALAPLGVPVFAAPERAADGMRALVVDGQARHRLSAEVHRPPSGPVHGPQETLDEAEAKTLLASWGIQTTQWRACLSRVDAHAALTALGAPVVVKILDARVSHKSDVGGVHVGIRDATQLDAALAAIDEIGTGHRYLVERMVAPGPELIIGATRDAAFGPVLVLGIGGVAVEALRLAVMRSAPLSTADTRDMLDELPGRALLEGYRGQPAADLDELAELLCRTADLFVAHEWMTELDLNPVRVTADGLVALDALVVTDAAPTGA